MTRSPMIAGIAVVIGFSLSSGCRSVATAPLTDRSARAGRSIAETSAATNSRRPDSSAKSAGRNRTSPQVAQTGYEDDDASLDVVSDADDPFSGTSELDLPALLEAVQSRNPSLQAAYGAWSAASERYPQVVALDDPMFQSMSAPRTYNAASNVQSSYYLGVAQKIPWSGKRELRGNQANWESQAAMYDYHESQQRLAEAARLAFFDDYLIVRQRELNSANKEATREFRDIARAKYEANQATQNDVLQADVELAKLEQRQIELDQQQAVALARINTLLHRRPDHALPPPPQVLSAHSDLPPLDTLRNSAEENRPELQAMLARVQAEQSAVALACKEYYPDFEVMARYDRFWTDKEQRPQVGLNMNVPLNQSKRAAAVREANARVYKLQAEYQQARDNVWHDVAAAYARANGSRKTIRLFESQLLPAAEANVSNAKSGYSAGTLDFLRVIDAQRQLIELREQQQMAIVELHRRQAELERAIGGDLSDAVPVPVQP